MKRQPIRKDKRGRTIPRVRMSLSGQRAVRKAVEREARHFGVSMSFVLLVAAADALGVRLDHDCRYKARKAAHTLRLVAGRDVRRRKVG